MSTKPTVYEALNAVMEQVQSVRKGDRNTQQNYSFRGIDAVVNAVGPALRAHGVIVVPHVEDVQYNVVEVGQRRTPMRECTVRVRYVFHGPSGDHLDCVAVGEAMDSGDKATPKAMSVAMRVALLQALCIPTDEPDVDSVSYERAPRTEPQAPRPARPTPEEVYAKAKAAVEAATNTAQLNDHLARIDQRQTDGLLSEEAAVELIDLVHRRHAELTANQPQNESRPEPAPVGGAA